MSFIDSWDQIELYYKELSESAGYEFTKPLVELIAYMREQNFDKDFRAGKSMWIFFLSRSSEYGLRNDQHRIGIEPTKANSFRVFYRDGKNLVASFETVDVKTNEHFAQMINRLKSQPVN
jgi:hypothetical protein